MQLAQVVWNSTFEIGVGSARPTLHGDIVCVRYSPRGADGDPEMYKNNIFPKIGKVSEYQRYYNQSTFMVS